MRNTFTRKTSIVHTPLYLMLVFFVVSLTFAHGQQSIFVIPTQPWMDTGLSVSAGDELTITATGEMDWNTNNTCPVGQSCTVGPNGQNPGVPCPVKSVLAPSLACVSLIGKIGNGTPFEVGASFAESTAPASGELYLSVNDSYFADNTQGWTATISTGNCTEFWNVDSSKMQITPDPQLTSGVYPDPNVLGDYMYVFAGEHIGRSPNPFRVGFEVNARSAITLKLGADKAQAGQLIYVQNLYQWSGIATYGKGVEEYPAALAPGVDLSQLAVLDGNFDLINFFSKEDSPNIHIPLMDKDARPLTKISYSKGFKLYMGCAANGKFHTLAIVPWHVLFYGSVFVPHNSGTYYPKYALFVPSSGAAVYYDPLLTTHPLPQPVTGAPIANCVVGFQDFPPAVPYSGNPGPICSKTPIR